MGIQRFQIIFDDNPHGVYYGGQTITGQIIICFNSDTIIKGINLALKGYALVHWTENRTETNSDGTTRTETDTYSNSEIYFDNVTLIYAAGNSNKLPVGEHRFPFNFILPNNLPASFEGGYGYVRYTAKASILNISGKSYKESTVIFTIVSPLDLNERPGLQERLCTNKEKTYCCWCCTSGPLAISFSIPVGGAVPGENVLADIEIENTSNVKLNHISIALLRAVTFHASTKSTTAFQEIPIKSLGNLDARCSRNWNREAIRIPALPPSELPYCSIIDLKYTLRVQVVAKPSGPHKTFELPLPIVIGTIPFYQRFNEISPTPSDPAMGWNDNKYHDLPSPSHEESVFGGANICENNDNDANGDKNFAPRYPVYNYQ